MSEERMICIKDIGTSNIERWIPVEPAPPKGWRPSCWEPPITIEGKLRLINGKPLCFGFNFTRDCEQCPYRNLE